MNDQEFEHARHVQNSYLRWQLENETGELLHEIRCVRCRKAVLQVIQLDPWRVVRTRTTIPEREPLKLPDVSQLPPGPERGYELYRAWSAREKSLRLDSAWMFVPIPDGEPRRREMVATACGCAADLMFELSDVLAREGKKSECRPPRRQP